MESSQRNPQERLHPSSPFSFRNIPMGGFTLLEAVIAIGSSALLLVGLSSTLLIASRTASSPQIPRSYIESSSIASRVLNDLREAIQIHGHDKDFVEFLRSDCDGDGVPDVCRYEYFPDVNRLTRSINGETPETISDDVYAWSLDFQLVEESETVPITQIKKSGVLFHNFEDPPNPQAKPDSSVVTPSGNLISQTFAATDFSTAINSADWYRITKVHAFAELADLKPAWMQLRYAGGDLRPTGENLTEAFSAEATGVGKAGKVCYTATLAEPLCHIGSRTRLALVMPLVADDAYTTVSSSGLDLAVSHSGGATWEQDNKMVAFAVEGELRTTNTDLTVTRSRYTFANLTVQVSDRREAQLTTATSITNRPLKIENQWEAKFDREPATIDLDGDGEADWVTTGFNPAQLSGGVWNAPKGSPILQTAGTHQFSGEVEVQLAYHVVGPETDNGLTFGIPWKRDGGKSFGVLLQAGRTASGDQTLRLFNGSSANDGILTVIRDLPDRMIRIRLLFVASSQVVLWIDGDYFGSYPLGSAVWSQNFSSLRTVDSSAKIDLLDIIEY